MLYDVVDFIFCLNDMANPVLFIYLFIFSLMMTSANMKLPLLLYSLYHNYNHHHHGCYCCNLPITDTTSSPFLTELMEANTNTCIRPCTRICTRARTHTHTHTHTHIILYKLRMMILAIIRSVLFRVYESRISDK